MLRCDFGSVDVGDRRKLGRSRLAANEALGMRLPRIEQDEASGGAAFVGAAVVNVARRKQRDSAVPVIIVVPGHETADVVSRLLDIRKMSGERWRVLERFELRFAVGIVVRNVRT